ncbi:MAG: Lrp/AsnC family transcriptional regulator [Candidatus Bathyarchaeota archaeon]|nr:Lrp/AsnC family transcriptional regulator [Candidatus Bathyarchaeota archaeon]MDH5662911.1 Lrp/AsnC family transcriptional regulator [Candidatus Bathyarchaeota archaeon]
MNKKMLRLLLELLKDSKRSDREIAKVLGVSQPTVTRTRQRLVKEGAIKEFTVIPDFVEMGYEIMAISCIKVKTTMITELEGKAEKYWKKYPNVIFVSRAYGMGKNGVLISLHKSYADYSNFLSENLLELGDAIKEYDSMLIDLNGRIVKPFSLKYLAEQEETS